MVCLRQVPPISQEIKRGVCLFVCFYLWGSSGGAVEYCLAEQVGLVPEAGVGHCERQRECDPGSARPSKKAGAGL